MAARIQPCSTHVGWQTGALFKADSCTRLSGRDSLVNFSRLRTPSTHGIEFEELELANNIYVAGPGWEPYRSAPFFRPRTTLHVVRQLDAIRALNTLLHIAGRASRPKVMCLQ
jgi:hypothetical protein